MTEHEESREWVLCRGGPMEGRAINARWWWGRLPCLLRLRSGSKQAGYALRQGVYAFAGWEPASNEFGVASVTYRRARVESGDPCEDCLGATTKQTPFGPIECCRCEGTGFEPDLVSFPHRFQ